MNYRARYMNNRARYVNYRARVMYFKTGYDSCTKWPCPWTIVVLVTCRLVQAMCTMFHGQLLIRYKHNCVLNSTDLSIIEERFWRAVFFFSELAPTGSSMMTMAWGKSRKVREATVYRHLGQVLGARDLDLPAITEGTPALHRRVAKTQDRAVDDAWTWWRRERGWGG